MLLQLVLTLGLVAAAAPPDRIAVFVALPERGGFVDAGEALVESQRQLQHEITVRKRLRLASHREDADVVLTIVRREVTPSSGGGAIAIPVGAMTVAMPLDNSVVGLVAMLQAGDFTREITGRFGWRSDAWQECAERVAKDVETWATVNYDRLLERRSKP